MSRPYAELLELAPFGIHAVRLRYRHTISRFRRLLLEYAACRATTVPCFPS